MSAIPVVKTGIAGTDRAQAAVKLRLDKMSGQLQNFQKLADLPATASLTDVITRLNEIKKRMQE